jgi:hypothetical protein
MQTFWQIFVFPALVSIVFLISIERRGAVASAPASCSGGPTFESQPGDRTLMVFPSQSLKMLG